MPIVGGLDIHRKQITFDYLCDMRPLAVSERVRPDSASRAPAVIHSWVVDLEVMPGGRRA